MTTIDPTTAVGSDYLNAQVVPTPMGCGGMEYVGGDFSTHVKNNSMLYFSLAIAMTVLAFIMLVLVLSGKCVGVVKKTTSKYSNSFVPTSIIGGVKQSNFGNSPNWYMQDGCAGYNCQVDTSNGKSLSFGTVEDARRSNFDGAGPNPVAAAEAQRRAREEAVRRSQAELRRQENVNHAQAMRAAHAAQVAQGTPPGQVSNMVPHAGHVSHMTPHVAHMAPRRENMTAEDVAKIEQARAGYVAQLDNVSQRQVNVLAGCDVNTWDPMATEEAQVLGSIGTYRPITPGMSGFSRAVNDNIPLTDSQLEAIMQGGEPFTIGPAGIQDVDSISAQKRREMAMVPPRKFV